MTNREWLRNLSDEELAESPYLCVCILGIITRERMRENGEPCPHDRLLCAGETNIAEFVFSGKSRAICAECKAKWLKSERKEKQR